MRLAFLLLPLSMMACTSNSARATDGNPAPCPTQNPEGQSTCYSNADGGVFSCRYACGAGETGSVTVSCDGSQWHATDTCAPTPTPLVAAIEPVACGNTTCAVGAFCVHECCDITPCTPPAEDGGCQVGSHPTDTECSGGCIDDHPECTPSDDCESTAPDDCIAQRAGYCASGCSD